MGRVFEAFFNVIDVGNVGYSLKKRGKTWAVVFKAPGADQYKQVSTGAKDKNTATVEAAKIILREYRPDLSGRPKALTWEELDKQLEFKLTANNNSADTYVDYAKTLRVIRATLPEAKGPLDITPALAEAFKDRFISTPYYKQEGGKAYQRSHRTLNAYIRKARSIWGKWIIKAFRATTANPWNAVGYAEVNRPRPVAPSEGSVTAFLAWVRKTYPDWPLPILFIQVKALIGSRLADLCSLRSGQLLGGYLYLDSEQLKSDNPRRVKLPETLFAALEQIKGPTWAWESYPDGLRACLKRCKRPRNKIDPVFNPTALYWFVEALHRDFNRQHPEHKIKSHGFRKRAVSELKRAGKDVDTVAKMLGMDAQTIRLYYLDMDRVDTDAHFAEVADKLLPK